MTKRNQLKARMTALYGFDADDAAWIAQSVRRMSDEEVVSELVFYRGVLGLI